MKEQLLKTLENSKAYTLAVADAMPEKNYQTRPADTVWKFGELLQHIAYGIHWWEDNYVKAVKTNWDPPPLNGSKKETIANLQKAYGSLADTINKSEINDEVVNGFYATLDHITHHRGQAVTYLRHQGIEPPEYSY